MNFKHFAARLTEMKKPLPLFPGSGASNKWKWKSSTIFSSMQFPMDGPSNSTYKVGILSWIPTGKPMQCLSAWELLKRSTKGEHLLKYPLGKKPLWQSRKETKERRTRLAYQPWEGSRWQTSDKKCKPYEQCAHRSKKYMFVAWPWKILIRV